MKLPQRTALRSACKWSPECFQGCEAQARARQPSCSPQRPQGPLRPDQVAPSLQPVSSAQPGEPAAPVRLLHSPGPDSPRPSSASFVIHPRVPEDPAGWLLVGVPALRLRLPALGDPGSTRSQEAGLRRSREAVARNQRLLEEVILNRQVSWVPSTAMQADASLSNRPDEGNDIRPGEWCALLAAFALVVAQETGPIQLPLLSRELAPAGCAWVFIRTCCLNQSTFIVEPQLVHEVL